MSKRDITHHGRTRDLAPLCVRFSKEERRELKRRARAAKVTESEYVRRAVAGWAP